MLARHHRMAQSWPMVVLECAMAVIWNDNNLELGIADVDADHKRKIDALNKVEFLLDNDAESSVVAKALDELLKGTAEHFAREEVLMRRTKFPRIAEHQALHSEFLDRLSRLHAASYKGDELIDARAEIDFFSDWMSAHIQNADRDFVRWLHPET